MPIQSDVRSRAHQRYGHAGLTIIVTGFDGQQNNRSIDYMVGERMAALPYSESGTGRFPFRSAQDRCR
jgi:hypothetical protein